MSSFSTSKSSVEAVAGEHYRFLILSGKGQPMLVGDSRWLRYLSRYPAKQVLRKVREEFDPDAYIHDMKAAA